MPTDAQNAVVTPQCTLRVLGLLSQVPIMNTRSSRVGLACLVLLLTGVRSRAEEPPPEVPVARAVVREWTDFEDFTGRTEAAARVELRARVTGYLVKTLVEQGAEVKKGDVLFEIDSRIYRVELDRVEAALRVAEARLKLADANHKRARTLFAQKSISQEEFDRTAAERAVAEAETLAAKAARTHAQLNLDYTRVIAPIDGRIGRRTIDPGNLVTADQTVLATLVRRDPVHVHFDVDERSVLRLRRSLPEGKGKAEKVPVAIGLADEDTFPRRGILNFTDIQVDPDTGTLRMRAVLPNKDGLLMPGLFVRVRLAMGAPYKALTVPERAVMSENGERFVYVVNDKGMIEQRAVTVGQARDGQRVVTRGLKAEERVVVGRLQSLQPGMSIRPREEERPAPKAKPASDSGSASVVPSASGQGGPGILVEAAYPGANAEVVADVVRFPIEQEINGIEKLRALRSRCTSDGRYALSIAFGSGVDLKLMQVLVQNRVNRAVPTLPEAVKNTGVSIKRGSSGVLMIVNLSSPSGDRDRLYLSNYANIQIKDELARVSGVADVTLLGASDFGLRIWLDPDRLAALGVNAGEVEQAIKKQKEKGGPDIDTFADLIVKTDSEGRVVRLKDVGRVELGAASHRSRTAFNGKPVVSLLVQHDGEVAARKTRAALRDRLAQLRERLPNGLDLSVDFDFTSTADYLLLDVDLPAAASAERVWQTLERCQVLVRSLPGVRNVLAISENPFDVFGGGPCLLIGLTPAEDRKAGRDEIANALRRKVDEIKEISVRVRDLSGASRSPNFAYPIDLAVRGPEAGRVREFAQKLAVKLAKDRQLMDVWANRDAEPRVQWTVDIDRTAAAARGVAVEDIFSTLQIQGGAYVADFARFGRTWRVQLHFPSASGDWVKDLRKLKVRGSQGKMIPLNVVLKVREVEAPSVLDFLDFWPMVEITANPASGVKLEEARKRCEALAEQMRKEMRLPRDYRLFWLP